MVFDALVFVPVQYLVPSRFSFPAHVPNASPWCMQLIQSGSKIHCTIQAEDKSCDTLVLGRCHRRMCKEGERERERERERDIHYVHSASLAYEDGIVLMSEPSAARQ